MPQTLEGALSAVLSAEVASLERLTGGASRETWLVRLADEERVILRRDVARLEASADLSREAQLLRAARAAGVPVPEVLASGDTELAAPWLVCKHVEGETRPRRILRDPPAGLARECGEILARIHAMPALSFLEPVDPLAGLRARFDTFEEVSPIIELAFRRLELTRPAPVPPTVVHGDFRNGNLIVGPDGVRAVLDWELCHLGDPAEDLAYICTRAWRFGGDGDVGGFGTVDELLHGYGAAVEPRRLRWWLLRATLWWGITCLEMARPHLARELRSVERAAIGRRLREQEYDLICLLRQDLDG